MDGMGAVITNSPTSLKTSAPVSSENDVAATPSMGPWSSPSRMGSSGLVPTKPEQISVPPVSEPRRTVGLTCSRSEERRVGKECRSSPAQCIDTKFIDHYEH